MQPHQRDRFDRELEDVLSHMPPLIHQLIDEVPLVVEDHPSEETAKELGIRYRDDLCGLYTGIPLSDRSVMHSGVLSDVVTIYREGITRAASDELGYVHLEELREQIRITILHELGHHHGLDEDELHELGYG